VATRLGLYNNSLGYTIAILLPTETQSLIPRSSTTPLSTNMATVDNKTRNPCATKTPTEETVHKKIPIPPGGTPEGITPETRCRRSVKPNKLTYNGQDYDISGPEHEAIVAEFITVIHDTTDATHEAFATKWDHLKLAPGAPVAFPYDKAT
jgi:hypothetical protein